MKVKWSDFALNEFVQTADYIDEHFGESTRIKFVNEVRYVDSLLAKQPYIGRKEPILERAALQYRSVKVSDINRIVYYIGEEIIEIVDFWDMRRNPELLAERVINNGAK